MADPAPDILVVDDDADIRDALATALELEGFAVRTARHGAEAWEVLRSGPLPGVVLLDLAMPVMTGQELLARVAAEPSLDGLPVVVVTAHGASAGEGLARAQASLGKPVDLDELVEVVRRHRRRAVA